MTTNPTCESQCIDSYCTNPVPKLLYAKVTDVSGCSAHDGKVIQLLYDEAASSGSEDAWTSDDPDLVFNFYVTSDSMELASWCDGDPPSFMRTIVLKTCNDPFSISFEGLFLCCGSLDLDIVEFP